MFLLVNLEGHLPQMGEIIAGLVGKYSVPISIVDSVEKLCPNCGSQNSVAKSTSSVIEGRILDPEPLLVPIKAEPMEVQPMITKPSESPPNVGRRTAAKHSAILRALERKDEDTKPLMNFDLMDLIDGNGPSSSAVPSGSSRSDSHTPTTDAVTSSGMQTPGAESADGDEAPMLDQSGEFGNPNFESMHPTLLACLISSTPNVFAQGSTSPGSDGASPSDMKMDPHDLSNPRILGHLSVSVTSSGKVRRGRIVYNSRDLNILENFYKADPNACADPMKKKQMMDILGVDGVRLKVWFQNRRRKDKIKWLKNQENTEQV